MRALCLAVVCAAAVLACDGESVVGGIDPPVRDASSDTTSDLGTDVGDVVLAPDVPADVPPARCTRDDECRGNELGLFACDPASGRCVACTPASDRCPNGQYCDPAALRCVNGCRDDRACATATADGGVTAARCDPGTRRCVACVVDGHCPPGNLCVGNLCVTGCSATQPCPSGQSCCNGACVDPRTNVAHCGGCGMACAVANAAPACANGGCVVGACTGTFADCDLQPGNGCETNTESSADHCGACGVACPTPPNARRGCAGARCTFTCLDNFADCDGDPANGCETDLRSDPANCGACRSACGARNGTPTCVMGVCGLGPCADGFGDCDGDPANGCETDARTSPDHCGRCGNACPLRANAVAVCAAGSCGVRCNPGFADCDGDPANGCEIDTRTSTTHCGRCNNTCPARANGAPVCTDGACGVTCATGFDDCDRDPANGCEADTRTSDANCMRCGNACATGRSCVASVCTLVCPTGQTNCSEQCVDPRTSNAHCGACGNACATGRTCQAGLCCGARERNCGGACRNLNTDNSNCGACGIVCGAGTTCVNAVCESNTCLPNRACSGTACDVCGTTLFYEDWSAGAAQWRTTDGGAIATLSDASACAGAFMRETVLASGGRTFLRRGVPVRAGRTHCLSAWIRGSANTQPFIGINSSDANGAVGAEHWLIGTQCYTTSGLGPPVSPVRANGEWRWYAREFAMPNYTHVIIKTEIFSAGAPGTADFDGIQLIDGPCPQAPVAVCTRATCD